MFAKLTAYNEYLYLVFRVLVGLLFLQHGLQKIFGMFGGVGGASVVDGGLPTLMIVAGFIELLAGIAIVLGLFTRIAALLAAVEMLAAYFMVHAPQGFFPFVNKGELPLLYVAAFLILIMHGSRKWGLERTIMKKEMF